MKRYVKLIPPSPSANLFSFRAERSLGCEPKARCFCIIPPTSAPPGITLQSAFPGSSNSARKSWVLKLNAYLESFLRPFGHFPGSFTTSCFLIDRLFLNSQRQAHLIQPSRSVDCCLPTPCSFLLPSLPPHPA